MPILPARLVSRGALASGTALVVVAALVGAAVPVARAEPLPASVPGEEVRDVQPGTGARIVVRWNPSVSIQARARARSDAGTRVRAGLGDEDFQLLGLEPGTAPQEALRALRSDPRVAAADLDRYLETFSAEQDPELPRQWALQPLLSAASGSGGGSGAINVGPAWQRSTGSPDTVVAVIDSGYDFASTDLAEVAWSNPDEIPANGVDDDVNGYVDDVRGWDFVGSEITRPTEDADPSDDDPVNGGHGAHVSGILGARGNNGEGISGVAQDIRIMPLRVCARSSFQASNRCLLSAVVKAVNYAASNGARVANLSLGGSGYDQVLVDAFAAHPETLFVVAAGNDGRDNAEHPVYPCNYNPRTDSQVPGRVDNILCVAALDRDGSPADFTNTGASHVDLAAPGVEILSIYREYRREEVWSEDFEGADFTSRWSGSDGGFAVAPAGDGPLVTSGLTDSPGTPPVPGEHHLRSAPFEIPAGAEYCEVQGERFARLVDVTDFSYATWVEGAEAPSSFSLAVTWPKQELKRFATDVFDARSMAGQQVTLRLEYRGAPDLDDSYGVWLDNLRVVCGSVVAPAPLSLLSGTSMATPMVSGAAALLFSLDPTAGVGRVRSALLGGARRTAAWSGLTVTGGRLDVAAAMGHLVPPETRFAGPVVVSGRNVAIEVHQAGSLPGIGFQCRLGAGPWRRCATTETFRGLLPGRYLLQGRAVDPYGNVDPTPARTTFVVGGCVVPALRGTRVARARTLLQRAGCTQVRLSKPRRPAGTRPAKLRVGSVVPGPGTYRPAGAPVTLVLVRR